MAKQINKKCLECATAHLPGAKFNNSHTPPGLLQSLHPECYSLKTCSRKRGYYRNLEKQRKRARQSHRWIRFAGGRCAVCKSTDNLHVHHVKPRVRGGKDTRENTTTLCKSCHKVITCYLRITRQERNCIDDI
jgi:5-methylcytosine-specific restriction endonuclease McrA